MIWPFKNATCVASFAVKDTRWPVIDVLKSIILEYLWIVKYITALSVRSPVVRLYLLWKPRWV